MNSPQTKAIVKHIDDGVMKILKRVRLNTMIYAVSAVVVMGLVVMSFRLQAQQVRNFNLATEAREEAIRTAANQDARDKEYLDYIKRSIATWDKLQNDNPKVKVPRAPELRPSGMPSPTDKELTRPTPTPTATPIAKPKPKPKPKTNPKPIPTPFKWWPWSR